MRALKPALLLSILAFTPPLFSVGNEVFKHPGVKWISQQPSLHGNYGLVLKKENSNVFRAYDADKDYVMLGTSTRIATPRVSTAVKLREIWGSDTSARRVYDLQTVNLNSAGLPERVLKCMRNKVREEMHSKEFFDYKKTKIRYECYYASRSTCSKLVYNLKRYGKEFAACKDIASQFDKIFGYTQKADEGDDSYKEALAKEMNALEYFIGSSDIPGVDKSSVNAALAVESAPNLKNKMLWSRMAFDDLENNLDVCNEFFPTESGAQLKRTISPAGTKPEASR